MRMAWRSARGTFRFASGCGPATRFGTVWRSSGSWLPGGPALAGPLAREAVAAGSESPDAVRGAREALLRMIDMDGKEIAEIEKEMRARAAAETARLTDIPGIDPVGAMAFQAFAPPLEGFRRGRDISPLGRARSHASAAPGARHGSAGCRRSARAACAPAAP